LHLVGYILEYICDGPTHDCQMKFISVFSFVYGAPTNRFLITGLLVLAVTQFPVLFTSPYQHINVLSCGWFCDVIGPKLESIVGWLWKVT